MCGIIGYLSSEEKSVASIYRGLKKLEYRGYDSWGIVYQKGNRLLAKKGLGKLNKEPKLPQSKMALGHTRWATHGGITLANSHPHFDCSGSIALVHNGIIENFYQIKKEVGKENHHLKSETDTELVAHLLEDKMQTEINIEEAVRQVFCRLEGYNAFVVIEKNQEKMIVVKKGSPLVIGLAGNTTWVASDINALCEANKIIILEDDELAVIEKNKVTVKRVSNGQVIKKSVINMVNLEKESEIGKYKSFLEKEINEQPKVLENIAKNDCPQMHKIISLVKKMNKVIIIGCGTSFNAGLVVSEKITSVLGVWSVSVFASEFSTWLKLVDKDTLVVALTQSGETIDVIDALSKARQKGATTTSIVNAPYSSVQRITSVCHLLSCGVEKSVASTKTFVAQMAVFDKALGVDISQRASNIKQILAKKKMVDSFAKVISQKEHLFILGRGKMLPIAQEGALKIKELSYLHAEGMAGGELKHGTLALIEKGSVCIVLVSEENKNEMIASALEVKSRGAMVIGIAKSNEEVFDEFLPIRGNRDDEQTESVVWLQLLAGKISTLRHLDIDKPRNLAKSVTVK